MDFSKRLNSYITEIGCTAKELADASELSAAAISRYRTGERAPDPDGGSLRALSEGLAQLSNGSLDPQTVHNELAVAISGISVDYDTFLMNLNVLLETASVTNNELARALNFDPSYISRILTGQRRPADMQAFVRGVALHMTHRTSSSTAISESVSELVGLKDADLDESQTAEAIAQWLRTHYLPLRSPINSFLEKLDSFDLEDFIRTIHFDTMKTPTTPIQLPTRKTYTGLRSFMESEIDFLKAAVLSRSSADIIMYSDMPMTEMASDSEFAKKWMYGMAMLLKKGLHVRIIHRVDRPLHEMALGLESYIPMYMTGQISPYYFEGARDEVFCHLLRVSGTAVQAGEAIVGHHADGRYIVTKNRDEVRYFRRRAEQMLEKAKPLMRIIRDDDPEGIAELERLQADEITNSRGTWRVIMSTLPIGIIPKDVLESMLEREGLPEDARNSVRTFAQKSTSLIENTLENGTVTLEVPELSSDEFAERPCTLYIGNLPIEREIAYTYDEYRQHLAALEERFAQHPNSTCKVDRNSPFRNTQIRVRKGKYAVIAKCKNPHIYFIVEHPKLVRAFERFSVPVVEPI